jgi:DNA-binding NarL/FixJ family response regulator
VLILSASLDAKNLKKATDLGADEMLDKLAAPGDVLGAIKRIRTGKQPTPFDTTADTTQSATRSNRAQPRAKR